MLFAVMAHLDEELSLETILALKVEKPQNLLSGYIQTNTVHNIIVDFVLENINKK
jgi:hypothetical protein